MLKPFAIPPTLLVVAVLMVSVGELALGTKPIFVAFMAGSLICIGITYNLLGGVSTISGIAFAGFGLCTIVISQFAKVILGETADGTLEAPDLTIKVYFAFFLCVLIGTFVYRRVRVRLPKPLEPSTAAQEDLQYAISMPVGLLANTVFEFYEAKATIGEQVNEAHGLGLAFSALLLFSIVTATQARIRNSGGAHSFGIKVLIPWLATMFFGFVETSRGHILTPSVVYALTCYFSGYRFKRKHYLAAVVGLILFVTVISPFEIYSRDSVRSQDFQGRIYEALNLVVNRPSWAVIAEASAGGAESFSREEYFERPGTFVLSRVSAIRADSNMISACSAGYHYGFAALKIDILHNVPHFLYKDKPEQDSAAFTGRVTGTNADWVENRESMITAISDSFGAFGWLGVVIVGTFAFPACFIVYESMFDIRRPWGIVAVGGFCTSFAEISTGGLVSALFRTPIAIVMLSYLVGVIVRMTPVRGAATQIAGQTLWDKEQASL